MQQIPLIISNNCCGGALYNVAGKQYDNPFIWTWSDICSMKNVIECWDTINWFSIDLIESSIQPHTYTIVIDGKVKLNYVHHLFNPIKNTPSIVTEPWNGIEYNKIWEIVVQKYFSRIHRMLKLTGDPVFVIHDDNWYPDMYTCDYLCNIDSRFKVVIVTRKSYSPSGKNVKVFKHGFDMRPVALINTIYKPLLNMIEEI